MERGPRADVEIRTRFGSTATARRPGMVRSSEGLRHLHTVVGPLRPTWSTEPAGRPPMPDRDAGLTRSLPIRLLGQLLDRAHEMPPQLIAPLVAGEVHAIGGRDVSILLQDYAQLTLVSLPGRDSSDEIA